MLPKQIVNKTMFHIYVNEKLGNEFDPGLILNTINVHICNVY